MDINLNTVEFQAIFQAAILQALDEKKREELIKGALQHLLSKRNNNYNSETYLQEAFNNALRAEATESIRKWLSENKEFQEQINGLITEAVKKLTNENRENTVSKIASNIIDAIKPGY